MLFSILFLVFIIIYLFVFFSHGVWHGDTFLYKKSNGLFVGSNIGHNYAMQMTSTTGGMDFSFTVDEKAEQYRVLHNAEYPYVQIFKNSMIVYEGHAIYDGHQYILTDADDNLLEIGESGVILITEDSFPTYSQLLNWSLSEEYEIRGNMVIFYILIAVIVFLGLSFFLPKLSQLISRSYLACKVTQKRLQRILCGAIVILVPLSFILH